jgi:hypothetical protein
MIRVALQKEPASFDVRVRAPGTKAIADFKAGRIKKLPEHWRKCIDELWQAYSGICAYMCVYIDRIAGARTVEHMAPKSKAVDLAYEWNNYRLVCSTMNGRKSDFEDVLDPVKVKDGWFVLTFPACEVAAAPRLSGKTRQAVLKTIARLKLNDAKCLSDRSRYLDDYQRRDTTFAFLSKYSPFLARELDRQGLRRPGD